MSASTPTPTTTYPFTYTTYSTSLATSSFTRPTVVPSLVPFGAAFSCSASSVATPQGSNAACAISNAREFNDHAFWDLYECCKGKDLTASGSPNPCTAQCVAEDGQTWQELGECLNKRVNVVVCKPAAGEIRGNGSSFPASSAMSSAARSVTSSASGTGSGNGAQASMSTGAGNALEITHASGTKAAVVVFGALVIGSFTGMML